MDGRRSEPAGICMYCPMSSASASDSWRRRPSRPRQRHQGTRMLVSRCVLSPVWSTAPSSSSRSLTARKVASSIRICPPAPASPTTFARSMTALWRVAVPAGNSPVEMPIRTRRPVRQRWARGTAAGGVPLEEWPIIVPSDSAMGSEKPLRCGGPPCTCEPPPPPPPPRRPKRLARWRNTLPDCDAPSDSTSACSSGKSAAGQSCIMSRCWDMRQNVTASMGS
mmetsp:Transcript_37208/g.109777  ORF Transcript_37208/g.109777 Transcript_37208/m.109777 type:complete len:223 (-) Transcript_37208:2523-3191(-)